MCKCSNLFDKFSNMKIVAKKFYSEYLNITTWCGRKSAQMIKGSDSTTVNNYLMKSVLNNCFDCSVVCSYKFKTV